MGMALALVLSTVVPVGAVEAATNAATEYEAVQVPIRDKTGQTTTLTGLSELQVKPWGTNTGTVAYSINMNRQIPDAAGTRGYQKTAATQEALAANVDAAQSKSTLLTNVRNVLWNGHPYYGGTWKGVVSDLAGLDKADKMDKTRLHTLYSIQTTQQAIWHYTDSRAVANNGATKDAVNALIASAQKNPAPSNLNVDYYSAAAAKGSVQKSYQNLVAASASKSEVTVKVETKWFQNDGKTAYTGTKPSVKYELYEGASITAGEKPIQTYELPDGFTGLSIDLAKDGKTYTLREVLSGTTEGFTTAGDKEIKADGDTSLSYTHTYQKSAEPTPTPTPDPINVNLQAQVTLDGKTPGNGAFTTVLKDASGKILQSQGNIGSTVTFGNLVFDKTGTYDYTLSLQPGTGDNVTYDKTVYNVTVNVTEVNGKLASTVVVKKDGAIFNSTLTFNSTTDVTTTKTFVTVQKVWKSDKQSTRPSTIKVQLYRDGTAYGDPVTLSADNGWQHSWNNLDKSNKWTVDETAVPSNYTKKVTNSGNIWTITNTGKTTTTTGTTNNNKTNGTSTKTTGTKATSTTTKKIPTASSSKTSTTSDKSTPQTGDESHTNVLISIAIFSLGGMLIIAAFWLSRKRRRN